MKNKKKLKWLTVAIASFLLWFYSPYLIFDLDVAGYDVNMEYDEGKTVAWGPRPRGWLRGIELTTRLYTGDEFFYRYYKEFCLKWLSERNMVRPPEGR